MKFEIKRVKDFSEPPLVGDHYTAAMDEYVKTDVPFDTVTTYGLGPCIGILAVCGYSTDQPETFIGHYAMHDAIGEVLDEVVDSAKRLGDVSVLLTGMSPCTDSSEDMQAAEEDRHSAIRHVLRSGIQRTDMVAKWQRSSRRMVDVGYTNIHHGDVPVAEVIVSRYDPDRWG